MRRLSPRTISLLAALLAATPLLAQSRPDSSAARLPTVTVSATRTAAPLLRAPLAVSQIGIERLRSTAGIGIADALQGIPGVMAMSRAGGVDTRITIRGFGARGAGDRSNAATMRGIRVMVDGIPETEPDGRTSLDIIDLATVTGIDVVRSNASAIWGNAAGGVIAINTTPAAGNLFDVRTMAGSFGLRRVIAQTSTGTGESRLYAAASVTQSDGWRRNSAGERTLLNAGFLSPLGDRTRLALRLSASRNDFGIPGPLAFADALADPRAANATYDARRERRENQVIRFGTSIEHAIGSGALSIMSYVTPKTLIRSERGTYREFQRVHGGGGINYRQALGEHALLVGGDIQHQDGPARFWSLSATGEQGSTLLQDKNERAVTAGLFVQDEWSPLERLTLTLGARLDGLRYGVIDRITPQLDATRTYSQVSPKLGAAWRASHDRMFYANVGAGVETPAGNETDPASTFGQDTVTGISPLLQPIRSLTYEIGTRHLITDVDPGLVAIRYEAAVYNTEVRNELVPYRGGRFYFSAGRARRQGVELGGEIEFRQGFAVSSTATLSRNTYLEYAVDSVHYGKPGAIANFAGNAMVGVPRSMGMIGARWDAGASPFRVDAEMQHTGSYVLNDANTVDLPAATVFNATVALRRPAPLLGRIGITGFVRVENLLDRRFMTSGFLNPDVVAGRALAFEPGLPRAVIVSLGLVRLP